MKPLLSPPASSTLLVLDALDREATAAAERMGDAVVLQTLLTPEAAANDLGEPTGATAHVHATLEYAVALLGVRRVVVLVGASGASRESSELAALLAARYRTLVADPHVERLLVRSRVTVTCVALVEGVAAWRWSPGDDDLGVGEPDAALLRSAAGGLPGSPEPEAAMRSSAPRRLQLVPRNDHVEMG